MERCICIHGHFYQPPRENPWLETVELQDSASPYHDWNERITAECYATNAVSRILDPEGYILQLVNNYSRMSFNFGPTLLSWLELNAPDVYKAVVEADLQSRKRFSGHGSALAQAYNHMIMPLANTRDKVTQVLWGMRDFEHRFGRPPEGMWLPETAVDLETLDIMATHGIRFTVLAPHQAARVRPSPDVPWEDVTGGEVDPRRPYSIRLPSGREMAIFFYDGPISRAVAFEGLLANGETFYERLMGGLDPKRQEPQLVHIATDGESYGHHHRFGDMALAYALHLIESKGQAVITNYGQFLERHPPTWEVEIYENTSWSCAHGIERWRTHCGCSTGAHPEWSQAWRGPLREAMDWLRDKVAAPFERRGADLLRDPWAARDDYIQVILDRSPESVDRFIRGHSTRELDPGERTQVLMLMELQRHAMLMYTSCGWFFDEISGLEGVQVLQYAGRVLQLAGELFGEDLEGPFLKILETAKSNVALNRDGSFVFHQLVKPKMIHLRDVAAHYAISSLFEDYPQRTSIFCYEVDRAAHRGAEAGKAKLALGRASLRSTITMQEAETSFGVLHMGDHNLQCGVREDMSAEAYDALVEEAIESFQRGDLTAVMGVLDRHLGQAPYSLHSLFRDEQRKILDAVLSSTVEEAEALYRQIYENNIPLLRYLRALGIHPPKALLFAAELVLNASIKRIIEEGEISPHTLGPLLEDVGLQGIALESEDLEFLLRRRLEDMAEQFLESPRDEDLLARLQQAVEVLPSLSFEVNLWRAQNLVYRIAQDVYPRVLDDASAGDSAAGDWIRGFADIADRLRIRIHGDPVR